MNGAKTANTIIVNVHSLMHFEVINEVSGKAKIPRRGMSTGIPLFLPG
jgi:hypothetical protein